MINTCSSKHYTIAIMFFIGNKNRKFLKCKKLPGYSVSDSLFIKRCFSIRLCNLMIHFNER